ncbi:hypothetical protein T05_9823 [Trichinella murrelli]|uniref:Uncharacterized protein n=1 Tax=Trichinella murrelli TaxID=144512 RepID=A0A0V0TVF6_9BILA|nr:hypothetical protein T05_9823 [Trichinella murrelli]
MAKWRFRAIQLEKEKKKTMQKTPNILTITTKLLPYLNGTTCTYQQNAVGSAYHHICIKNKVLNMLQMKQSPSFPKLYYHVTQESIKKQSYMDKTACDPIRVT